MPVYALYIPTARRPVSGIGMECFASRELTGRVLKARNVHEETHTFYVGDPRPKSFADWPKRRFTEADETGYMRVFLRYARDPVPGLLDRPDEEWVVREGGQMGVVERIPWSDGDEDLVLADGFRLYVKPAVVQPDGTPSYEVRTPTKVKPAVAACPGCGLLPSVTGRCGCS